MVGLDLRVGDVCVVETATGTAVGEVRRPRREVRAGKKAQLFGRVLAPATDAQAEEWRRRRQREERAIERCRLRAREMGLRLKVIDVEIEPDGLRIVVYFTSEERVDFRDLVRELAPEVPAPIQMRHIAAPGPTQMAR